MIKMDLQFLGSRGASGGDGESLGTSSGENINIISTTDVWSYRHNPNNEPYVDAINTAVRGISDDFPGLMNDVNTVDAAVLGGADRTQTLGFYGGGQVAINANYTNVDKMNRTYDAAVASGFHPGRGDKSGTEAVTYHEMGHALTDSIKTKMGKKDLDAVSKQIVDDAYKATKGKGGTKAWAGAISGYAQKNYAECVAEAVCDWYCNGNKAKSESKAIMTQLKKYA